MIEVMVASTHELKQYPLLTSLYGRVFGHV